VSEREPASEPPTPHEMLAQIHAAIGSPEEFRQWRQNTSKMLAEILKKLKRAI
jgi:fibrillarin-like rRNA methylase